jgi:hypothetical protein
VLDLPATEEDTTISHEIYPQRGDLITASPERSNSRAKGKVTAMSSETSDTGAAVVTETDSVYSESASIYSTEYASTDERDFKSGTGATTVSGISPVNHTKRSIVHDPASEPIFEGFETEPNDDTASMFTYCQDFDIPADTKESLISAFSRILCQSLDSVPSVPQESLDTALKVLLEYLKDFSIQLKGQAKLQHEKLATVFVRELKGYV